MDRPGADFALPFEPTLLSAGILGADRARHARLMMRAAVLDNPMAVPVRTALLCAALEREGQGNSIHATGLSLAPQGDELVDVAGLWSSMADDPAGRRLLRATVELGQGRTVPQQVLLAIYDQLGPWSGAWQDLVAFSAWADALHRTHLPMSIPHPDPRVDDWVARLVAAGGHLPRSF